jgi:hypothetical protein
LSSKDAWIADLDFVCLDQLIQERTVFRNIGFFLDFLRILDIPMVIGIGFSGSCFGFSLDVGSGFCLDIGVLVNQSIRSFTNILLKY